MKEIINNVLGWIALTAIGLIAFYLISGRDKFEETLNKVENNANDLKVDVQNQIEKFELKTNERLRTGKIGTFRCGSLEDDPIWITIMGKDTAKVTFTTAIDQNYPLFQIPVSRAAKIKETPDGLLLLIKKYEFESSGILLNFDDKGKLYKLTSEGDSPIYCSEDKIPGEDEAINKHNGNVSTESTKNDKTIDLHGYLTDDAKRLIDQDLNTGAQDSHNIITKGLMTDYRDGKSYKTIRVGNQILMAENLNYKIDGSRCLYNKSSNCQILGRLYYWKQALNVCPSGWHLPSNREWKQIAENLASRVGISSEKDDKSIMFRGLGKYLNDDGLNSFGFSALPVGGSYANGKFFDMNDSYFWSSTEESNKEAWYWTISQIGDGFTGEYFWDKFNAFSVRCFQDKD